MTGQGMLFDAPTMDGQAPMFGDTYEWAPDPGGPELVPHDRGELGPELVEWNGAQVTAELVRAAAGEVERDRIRKQTELYADRANEARDHRRECDRCQQRGRCPVSRKLDTNQRAAADVLRMMRLGEL